MRRPRWRRDSRALEGVEKMALSAREVLDKCLGQVGSIEVSGGDRQGSGGETSFKKERAQASAIPEWSVEGNVVREVTLVALAPNSR